MSTNIEETPSFVLTPYNLTDLFTKCEQRCNPLQFVRLPLSNLCTITKFGKLPSIGLPTELLCHIASFLSFDDAAKFRSIFFNEKGKGVVLHTSSADLYKKMKQMAWTYVEPHIRDIQSDDSYKKFVISKMLIRMADSGLLL